MKTFTESLLAYTDLVENNCRRVNSIAEITHKELSKFDSGQLKELSQLEFGQGLLVLADRYALNALGKDYLQDGRINPGLRTFEEWIK